jgi:hypothetical protein
MHPDFRIGMLVVGAIFILAAIVGGKFKSFGSWLPRVVVGLVGAGLIIWGLIPYLNMHGSPGPEAVGSSAPPPAPAAVDPVETATSAMVACHDSTAPPVPEGATASLDQMAAARKAFQAYDAAIASYVSCVDSTVDRVSKQAAGASDVDLQRVKNYGENLHNAAIDREQTVVGKFNEQLRAYKTKHPASNSKG